MAWRTILFLAWRNLWRNRRRTIITASTISLGFALAIVSIGLGDGSHNQTIRNAIRLGDGHLTIQPKGYLETPGNHLYLKNSEALLTHPALIRMRATVAPRAFLQVLASTAHNSLGAGLQGVEATRDPYARILGEHLTAGKWIEAGDERGIVIGSKMAAKLKAKVGSKVVILAGGDEGELEARLGRVRGIFSSGIDDLDGLLVRGFPSDLSAVTLAVVASPSAQPTIGDSAVLHFRGRVGEETELTLLGGTLRDEPVAGGSLETSWLGAGWRLEALAFEPRGRKERETQAVAGVDFRFGAGLLLLAEIYHHTLGALAEADLPRVAADPVFLEGRLPQLAGTVFGAGFSYEFGGLWTSGFNLLASALRDDQGRRRPSLLHRTVLTYSLSDEAEANFVILAGSGPKAEPTGRIHSEFGHLPDTLLVSVKFVL